jgi:CubicO group peptidase (beta-lactamase class C family)
MSVPSIQRAWLSSFRRRRLVWLVAGMLVLVAGVGVLVDQVVIPQVVPTRQSAFQRVLDGLVSGPGRIAPGVTAYLAGPQGVLTGSAGIANATTGAPMTTDARLRLESVGKLWTATLILKLVGEGKLTLDDTVAHWLPGLLPYGNQITVEELLSMTSGMIDTNDFYAKPAYYLSKIKDPALRARVLAAANHDLALLEHRLHGRRADRATRWRCRPRHALPHQDHRSAPPHDCAL